jgi:hypothetical protein
MKAIRLAGLAMVLSLGAVSFAQAQQPAPQGKHARGEFGRRQAHGFGALLKGFN